MVTYVINQTDSGKTPVNVPEKTVNQSDFAIALFGREKLQYGELMNENILHLLENFSCPEGTPGNPELDPNAMGGGALDYTLSNATEGQLWYNETNGIMYMRHNSQWIPLSLKGDVAANYGSIAHGQQLPLPVSESGYVFDYPDCAWMVSPRHYPDEIGFMRCYTDTATATVTMQYTLIGDPTLINGTANYLIIGIRNNDNQGTTIPL